MTLSLNKKAFQIFLVSLGKIHDTCILDLGDDGIHGIASSDDNSMFAHAFYEGEFDTRTLNLPSLKKLSKALGMIEGDDVDLVVNSNHMEYKDDQIKFKYHLHEDGIITKSKLSLEKISNFEFDIEFDFNFDFLFDLLRKSAITSANKLYIYTDNGSLVWKLGDETAPNTDTFSIVGDEVDFELDPFIMKIDNLKLLSKISKGDSLFKINSKLGVGCIQSSNGDLKMEYIFSSLKN